MQNQSIVDYFLNLNVEKFNEKKYVKQMNTFKQQGGFYFDIEQNESEDENQFYSDSFENEEFYLDGGAKTSSKGPVIRLHKKTGRKESHDILNFADGISRTNITPKSEKDEYKKVFEYHYNKTGKKITDPKVIERIENINIPPSWTDVWIAVDPEAKMQAIGIDLRLVKQYRYSKDHEETSKDKKYKKLIEFIKNVDTLLNNVKLHGQINDWFDKKKVIATMITMVKDLHIRAGKEENARINGSFGIASIEKQHVQIKNGKIHLRFMAKSNQIASYEYDNKYVVEHLRNLLTLEGEKVFQYYNDKQKLSKVNYKDLNDYIHEFMGKQFTTKDFRTYAANYHVTKNLILETIKNTPVTKKAIATNIKKAIEITAEQLRHTKGISKKSYINNFIILYYDLHPEEFIKIAQKGSKDLQDKYINQVLVKILLEEQK